MTRLVNNTVIMTVDRTSKLVTLTGSSINAVLVVNANGTAPLTNPDANIICSSYLLSLHFYLPLIIRKSKLIRKMLTILEMTRMTRDTKMNVADMLMT